MSFITKRRLFANQVKPTMLTGYIIDLLALVMIWTVVSDSIPQLNRFSSNAVQVIVPPSAVAFMGFVFLYGVRISTYVAMIRKNRAPQVIEWWCMLIGIIVPLSVFLLDDVLLRAYASASGYGFCGRAASTPLVQDLFTLHGHPCPPK